MDFLEEMRGLLNQAGVNPSVLSTMSSRIELLLSAADQLEGSEDKKVLGEVMARILTRLSGRREIQVGELTLTCTPYGIYFARGTEQLGEIHWQKLSEVKDDIFFAGGTASVYVHYKLLSLVNNNKIRAIKALRDMYSGIGLREAKEAIDKLQDFLASGVQNPTYAQILKGMGEFAKQAPNETVLDAY